MRDAVAKVREFHERFGLPNAAVASVPPRDRVDLRVELIREEFREFIQAALERNIVASADALADLVYVTIGAALEFGVPLAEVFDEVHRSNMTKLWPDGLPRYRDDGKVLKSPDYSPPDIVGLL